MRGFVSGVFWGLATSAVVFVVAALRLGDPEGAVVEGEDPEAVVPEAVVVVPDAEDAEGAPGEPPQTGGLGVSTGPSGVSDPFEASEGEGPVAVDVEPPEDPGEPAETGAEPEAAAIEEPAEPEAAVVEPEEAEATVIVEEPEADAADPAAAAPDDGGEPAPEDVDGDVEVREDGATVIERTVPVEPVEEDG